MPKKRKNITRKKVRASENKPYVPTVEVRPETDDEDCGDDGLTVKQRLLVAALSGPAAGNQTKAAEMAGYKSDNRKSLQVTASQQLSKPMVQAALARALARKCASPEWVKDSLTDLARSSMANFVSVDANGEAVTDFAKAAAAGALGQIKELKERIIKTGDDDRFVTIERTIKIHDRTAALGMLARMHKLIDGPNEAAVDGDERFFDTTGQLAESLPAEAVPEMPADTFAKPDISPTVAGGSSTSHLIQPEKPRPQ